jgi:hypothetical protein
MGPYEVAAIGPEELSDRFSASPTARLFRSLKSTYGMTYDVRRVEDVTLPGAAEPRLRFARPARDGDDPTGSPDPSPTGPSPTGPGGTDPGPSGRVPSNSPSTNSPGGGP